MHIAKAGVLIQILTPMRSFVGLVLHFHQQARHEITGHQISHHTGAIFNALLRQKVWLGWRVMCIVVVSPD
jgi:hypothetical protein